MKKHIVITGPGRSGTTFLMRLLYQMGEEVWLEPDETYYPRQAFPALRDFRIETPLDKLRRAGLEWMIDPEADLAAQLDLAPRIIKAPAYVLWLREPEVLERIEHIIVPVRNLVHIVQSRADVGLANWVPDMPTEDITAAWAIGRAIEAACVGDLPLTILYFPKMVDEPGHIWMELRKVFNWDDSNYRTGYIRSFTKVARPDMVKFRPTPADICTSCNKPIHFTGSYWVHTDYSPRHPVTRK